MRVTISRTALAALLALGLAACGDTETKYVVTQEIPACSAAYPGGACASGQTCFQGACVASTSLCSPTNLTGTCASGFSCYGGGCILASAVPPVDPPVVDPCSVKVNTVQPTLKFASDFITTNNGKPTGTGGAAYTYDHDANTATAAIEVPYTKRAAITVDSLQVKDLNVTGTLEKYEDWRYSPVCRAKDLVTRMTVAQKAALMGETSSIGAGSADGVLAQSTINTLFVEQQRQALIRAADITPQQYATYLNNVQALSEGAFLGIPFAVTADPLHFVTQSTSNAGVQSLAITPAVSQWPNPMGLGAVNDASLSFQYGDVVRKDFLGLGFRWQLGPMVDAATEPRWARWHTTLGETAYGAAKHGKEIILGFQAGRNGLAGGIAATMKHFPGAGPDEEGKDSHSAKGKYNVYPGGMFEYHLLPFQAAIDAGVAAVMPCYSIEKGITDWNPEQVGTAFSHGMITRLLKDELGFDGMVTSDWGIIQGFFPFINAPHGVEALTTSERTAMFVKAGSHQIGFDAWTYVKAAYDEGLLTEADLDGAAVKILELSYRLGLFENPYTDAARVAASRSTANMQAGFDAQKRSIVLLKNASAGAGRLPISQTRYADVAGGTAGAPDLGEFASDADKDGKVEVYYDGIVDALTGSDRYSTPPINMFADYDYRAAGSGTSGVAGFTLPVEGAASAATADIAVLRITARKGTYFGLDRGVPLSFDAPFPGFDADGGRAAAVKDAQKVIDLFRIRDGYRKADGSTVAAANANLKIVLVLHMERPAIVKPFVWGLKTLDERAGCDYTTNVEACYPVVSDEANVNQFEASTTTATAHAGVDTFLVEFGVYDRGLLDFLFRKNVPAGVTYGAARLPAEIPNSDAAVAAQYEDVPTDSLQPTYPIGSGSNLPAQ